MAADEGKPPNWGLCTVQDAIPSFDLRTDPQSNGIELSPAESREQRAELPTEITGDSQTGTETNMAYQGDVELRRGDQYLRADNLIVDQETGKYQAAGHVRYQDSGMRVIAETAHGDQDNDTHSIENLQYQLVSRRGNGGADRIEMHGADGALIGSTYSTCDPGQRHWELRARRIDVDTDEGWGVARGASIRLGKVPVLYMPWLKFPIDDQRHTGLLYPAISNSGRNGFDYRQPIYLNLAPNYDATLLPRWMSDRGVQLGGQFRYLYEKGKGQLDLNWMPSDDLVERRIEDIANGAPTVGNDPLRTDNRGMAKFVGNHNLDRHWQARANIAWISDSRYLEDQGNSLYGQAATRLTSTVGLYGRGNGWTAGIMADSQQLADYTLSDSSLPYNRLPRAYLNWEQSYRRWLQVGIDAEAVRFQHNDKGDGSRLDIKPYVSLPLQGAAWYITPTLAWRYTRYQLEEDLQASLGNPDRTPSRSLPIASLDAGLYFDRNTTIKGRSYLQTLEPRLYYLNVPYRDQDTLPRFDSRAFTFSWGQLFRDNRYSGPDRQGDANQLTLAVSSRFLRSEDGFERLALNLGQIHYFKDSQVVFPGEVPVEKGRSAWVADASYAPTDRWNIGLSYQWNPKYRAEDLASLRARYLLPDDGVVNLSYRYRRNAASRTNLLEQADFSFLYPVNRSWSVVGRYYYSLLDHKLLEGIAGVQWDSCCLAVRAVVRRYVRNRDGEMNNALQVEFVLKGLGSAGQDTERTLRRAILGYYRDDLYLVPPSIAAPSGDDDSSSGELLP
ncbi:LPS-assembly protein LptD [Pseudoxanthomonas kalamensis DSM 18571]|nr:LPS-assembly protein LptD [Pseudoxanthomonas kalamensis DSM 18571]